jgi:hypothetical protein
MATTGFAVTYAVTFEREFFHHGIRYYPGVAYRFTAVSESGRPSDASDDACTDYEGRFNYVDMEGGISIYAASDPVIEEIKEITPSAAGGNENELNCVN